MKSNKDNHNKKVNNILKKLNTLNMLLMRLYMIDNSPHITIHEYILYVEEITNTIKLVKRLLTLEEAKKLNNIYKFIKDLTSLK